MMNSCSECWRFSSSNWQRRLTSSRWRIALRRTSAIASSTSRSTSPLSLSSRTKSSKTSFNKPISERKEASYTTRCKKSPLNSSRNLANKPQNHHLLLARSCSRMCWPTTTRRTPCLTSAWSRPTTSTKRSHSAWFATPPPAAMISSSTSGNRPLPGLLKIRTRRLLSIPLPTKMLLGRSHSKTRPLWWARSCS